LSVIVFFVLFIGVYIGVRVVSGFFPMLRWLCIFVWQVILPPIYTVAIDHENYPSDKNVSMIFQN
ncbi:hypothetical protein, partial [Paramuribaculum intestinale]